MKIENFYKKIKSDVKELNKNIENKRICYSKTFKSYSLENKQDIIDVEISIYSLEILTKKNIDKKLLKKIKRGLYDNRILVEKKLIERQVFINFLRLYYKRNWNNIYFIDREKPDFKVFTSDGSLGYEITEAISNKDANYRKINKHMVGRNKSFNEIKKHAQEKHKNSYKNFEIKKYDNMIMLSPSKGMISIPMLREQIITSVCSKLEKSKNYDKFDKNYLIINYNSMGLDYEYELKNVSEKMREVLVSNKYFDKIYVIRNLYNDIVEYDYMGKLIKHNATKN